MKIGIIVQARMKSTRLPGKILHRVFRNDTMLEAVISRLKLTNIPIIIATPDDNIVEFCKKRDILYYQGSEDDVLDRYYQAAKKYELEAIIRITSDCPLIDPYIINQIIELYNRGYDYVSNTLKRTYPRGMDVEMFSMKALEKVHEISREREHVTTYFYTHPDGFYVSNLKNKEDQSRYRLTVDTIEDLRLIKRIYAKMDDYNFSLNDIIRIMELNPDWININSNIKQKLI